MTNAISSLEAVHRFAAAVRREPWGVVTRSRAVATASCQIAGTGAFLTSVVLLGCHDSVESPYANIAGAWHFDANPNALPTVLDCDPGVEPSSVPLCDSFDLEILQDGTRFMTSDFPACGELIQLSGDAVTATEVIGSLFVHPPNPPFTIAYNLDAIGRLEADILTFTLHNAAQFTLGSVTGHCEMTGEYVGTEK